jgi:putative flippase GtrA
MVSLIQLLRQSPLLASGVGATVGAFVSYILNHRFTFRSNIPHRVAGTRFIAVAGIGFVMNLCLFAALLRLAPLPYMISQMLTTLFVLAFSFALSRFWAFRQRI